VANKTNQTNKLKYVGPVLVESSDIKAEVLILKDVDEGSIAAMLEANTKSVPPKTRTGGVRKSAG
jgi:hypothetical protein